MRSVGPQVLSVPRALPVLLSGSCDHQRRWRRQGSCETPTIICGAPMPRHTPGHDGAELTDIPLRKWGD